MRKSHRFHILDIFFDLETPTRWCPPIINCFTNEPVRYICICLQSTQHLLELWEYQLSITQLSKSHEITIKSHEIYRWCFGFFVWNPSWFHFYSPTRPWRGRVLFIVDLLCWIHSSHGRNHGEVLECRLGCNHEIRKSVDDMAKTHTVFFFWILLYHNLTYTKQYYKEMILVGDCWG